MFTTVTSDFNRYWTPTSDPNRYWTPTTSSTNIYVLKFIILFLLDLCNKQGYVQSRRGRMIVYDTAETKCDSIF